MRDQVEQVHALYRDMANDPSWFARYHRDPESMLDRYSILSHNRDTLRRLLALYCRPDRTHV